MMIKVPGNRCLFYCPEHGAKLFNTRAEGKKPAILNYRNTPE